ncbi:DUF4964 domain-containing protein [Cesiribacter sp. SM1]|uniref:DUF4964 domain-containing protein n=1 Tax=Cesiribacter sp. SM1 TaxID=2861196 RepID=UPI001CD26045|nr:DUF4964 domain-containing protein [Cesiribacter sp. SM1]
MKQVYSRLLLILLLVQPFASCRTANEEYQQNVVEQDYTTTFRAPAYPLVTIDPYTSAWSMADKLYDDPVRHWTGRVHSLIGAVRVDGKVYRFMGKEEIPMEMVLPLQKMSCGRALHNRSAC